MFITRLREGSLETTLIQNYKDTLAWWLQDAVVWWGQLVHELENVTINQYLDGCINIK